jgi:hypothetical protein
MTNCCLGVLVNLLVPFGTNCCVGSKKFIQFLFRCSFELVGTKCTKYCLVPVNLLVPNGPIEWAVTSCELWILGLVNF